MKYKSILPILLTTTLLFSGCGNTNDSDKTSNTSTENGTNTNSVAEVEFTQTDDDMFSNRDSKPEYDENSSIHIQLNGTSASCDADNSAVTIEGTTITILDEGTYVISGTLENGMIIVNAEEADKPQLVFDNVTIHSETSAPLYILEADKVFVTLAKGSSNTLTNGGTFQAIDENNIDGTVFSKQDLTFNGSGSLTVSSPIGHGIVANDDLVFYGGSYNITSAKHGIDVNDSLRVKDASISVSSGKDGAHVENNDDAELGFIYISNGTFDIDAEGDGLSAGAYVQIEDGSFDIFAGGGYENGEQSSSDNWGNIGGGMGGPGGGMPGGGDPGAGRGGRSSGNSGTTTDEGASSDTTTTEEESTSMKGIKSDNSLQINGGTFSIDSADDALHSNTSVYINGGTYTIATGDDAFHGEEKLVITAGAIDISNSYEGLEALNITVSGGDISIQSTDDGINAAGGTDASGSTGGRDGMFGGGMGGMSANSDGSIQISGGSIFMYAQGDGLDANGYIELTGGTIIVTGPTSGDTAILDYDTSATVDGTTFIGVGSTMMAQTFSDGTQGTMAVQASGNAGTEIRIEDASGNKVVSFTPETAFQCVIISTPDIIKGDAYTIYVGTASGTFDAQ